MKLPEDNMLKRTGILESIGIKDEEVNLRLFNLRQNLLTLKVGLQLTRQDIAIISGVSERTVANWMSGSTYPSSKALYKLAQHFHLRLKDFWRVNGIIIISDKTTGCCKPISNINQTSETLIPALNQMEINLISDMRKLPPEVQNNIFALIGSIRTTMMNRTKQNKIEDEDFAIPHTRNPNSH